MNVRDTYYMLCSRLKVRLNWREKIIVIKLCLKVNYSLLSTTMKHSTQLLIFIYNRNFRNTYMILSLLNLTGYTFSDFR